MVGLINFFVTNLWRKGVPNISGESGERVIKILVTQVNL